MKLSQFKFKLPTEQVALYPHTEEHIITTDNNETVNTFSVKRPDKARLMVLHKKSQTIEMFRTDLDGNPMSEIDCTEQKRRQTRRLKSSCSEN